MQKKFGNGACGVQMKKGKGGKLMLRAKRRRKSLGHPSQPHGAVHHALARFHSEHVGN